MCLEGEGGTGLRLLLHNHRVHPLKDDPLPLYPRATVEEFLGMLALEVFLVLVELRGRSRDLRLLRRTRVPTDQRWAFP